jgi:hypothetical protein
LTEGVIQTMCVTKLQLLVATAATAASLAGWGLTEHRARADRAGRATRLDLTPETFAELHALVRPHPNEWRHLKVEWLTDVVAARKKAAREDKPLIVCYTGGAGYNEPLGTC